MKGVAVSTSQVSSRAGSIGLFAAVGAAIAFAGSGPFVKPLLEEGWTAGGAVLVRVLLAALVLAPIVAFAVRRDARVLLRRWKWITGYGVLGIAGGQVAFYLAVERLPVGIALLIQYMAPVLLLLAVWLRTRVRPATLSLIGTVLAIVGLVCVIDLAGEGGLDPIGIAFGVLAAIMTCIYFLIGANAPNDLPPVALIGGGLGIASVSVALAGTVGIVPLVVDFAGTAVLLGNVVPWWVPMGIVVLIGTVGGYVLGTIGAKLLGSRLASFVGLLDVVATVVVAALLLGEIPTLMQFLGGALILAGVIAVRLAPDHAKPAVDGGVLDVVGPATGVIPIPSRLEEEVAATGTVDLQSPVSELAVVTGVINLPTLTVSESEADTLPWHHAQVGDVERDDAQHGEWIDERPRTEAIPVG